MTTCLLSILVEDAFNDYYYNDTETDTGLVNYDELYAELYR